MEDFILRILEEARELAIKLNKLNKFMATDFFPTLGREEKDLLYEQNILMTKYLQVLGKRLEANGVQFSK